MPQPSNLTIEEKANRLAELNQQFIDGDITIAELDEQDDEFKTNYTKAFFSLVRKNKSNLTRTEATPQH